MRIAWVEVKGALKSPLSFNPLPLIMMHGGERSVSFRQLSVDFERLPGRGDCQRPGFSWRFSPNAYRSHEAIAVRQSGVSGGIGGIFFDGALEMLDGLVQ